MGIPSSFFQKKVLGDKKTPANDLVIARADVVVVWRNSLNGGFGQTILDPRQIFADLKNIRHYGCRCKSI
jgi:hypothetical protein